MLYMVLLARGIAYLPSDLQPLSSLLPQRGAGHHYCTQAAENQLHTCQDKGSSCKHLCHSQHNTAFTLWDHYKCREQGKNQAMENRELTLHSLRAP